MKREATATKTAPKRVDNTGVLPPLVSLKCQLCEEYLKDPVTLPCLHSFCRVCLEKYNSERVARETGLQSPSSLKNQTLDSLDRNFAAPESKESEENQKEEFLTVQCPTCIDVLGLTPPNEPQVPFENSRLGRIVGLVLETNVVCQNCSQAPSEYKCVTCNAWLCLDCWDSTHAAPIFESHEREGLTHSEMFALPKCQTHPKNDLEFFSTEEEIGVCQVCLLKGDFVGKPYCLVGDVRRARQHEIERGVRVVLEEKEHLLIGRQRMEQILDLLDRKLEQQTEAVKKNFSAIRAALEKREQETLSALTDLKATKAQVLSQQITQTDHILGTINDGIRNVKLILNHSNDLELVYLTIVLQEFVADLAKIDAPKFGFKFNEPSRPLEYFHSAAVDSELPVLLSAKVPELVAAYAPVPAATFEPIFGAGKEKQGLELPENGVRRGKLRLEPPMITKEHHELLKEVGAEDKADEYGCTVQ